MSKVRIARLLTPVYVPVISDGRPQTAIMIRDDASPMLNCRLR